MRLLLVEDEEMLGSALQQGLINDNYPTDWVTTAANAKVALRQDDYDLLLLDIKLPDGSGLDLLQTLRSQGEALPILIITARDSVTQRIEGLNLGADDYMVKPFDYDELLARIQAIYRRSQGRHSEQLVYGDIVFDADSKAVTKNGEAIKLSARELAILQLLLENVGRVLSKQKLEGKLYNWEMGVESNTIEVHISNLRKKLGRELIKTIRGLGYTIEKLPG